MFQQGASQSSRWILRSKPNMNSSRHWNSSLGPAASRTFPLPSHHCHRLGGLQEEKKVSIDLPYFQSNLAHFYFHSNVVGKSPIKGAKQWDNQTKWIWMGFFQSRFYQRMFRLKLLANANPPDKGRYEQKYGATLRTPTLSKVSQWFSDVKVLG